MSPPATLSQTGIRQPLGDTPRHPGRGHARLNVERVEGQSAVVSCYATSPLKLLTPRSRGPSAWVCLSTHGGGVVAGDRVSIDLRVGPGAKCFVNTQSSTKIYRNPEHRPSGQQVHARVLEDALLVWLPDPVQAFAGSSYNQHQRFELSRGASLVFVDGLSCGRVARGERWVFSDYAVRNEICSLDTPILIDATRLGSSHGGAIQSSFLSTYNHLGTIVSVGPAVTGLTQRILASVSGEPITKRAATILSASPVQDGVIVRIASLTSEAMQAIIRSFLSPLEELLGDSPWPRKG